MKLSELIEKYGDCEVTDELMEMLKPKGDWEPWLGENYYFISEDLQVSLARNKGDDYAYVRIMKRNVYRTKEEAQFALGMYHFCKERSFEPDWEDRNRFKYYLYLDYNNKEANYNYTDSFNHCSPFYYPTAKAAEEIINKYSFEELAKYYGRV